MDALLIAATCICLSRRSFFRSKAILFTFLSFRMYVCLSLLFSAHLQVFWLPVCRRVFSRFKISNSGLLIRIEFYLKDAEHLYNRALPLLLHSPGSVLPSVFTSVLAVIRIYLFFIFSLSCRRRSSLDFSWQYVFVIQISVRATRKKSEKIKLEEKNFELRKYIRIFYEENYIAAIIFLILCFSSSIFMLFFYRAYQFFLKTKVF